MAEEFKVLIGTELDTASIDSLKQQISGIKTNPVKIKIDTSDVTSQINKIKNQIQNLSGIKINLTGSSVGGGAVKNVSEVTKAYNDLMRIQKQLNSTRIKINGLDATKDAKQIGTLSGQLQRLQADYNNLYQTFNKHFSTDQLDNLNRAFEVTSNQISATNAKMADTSAIKQQKAAFKELLNISQQISKTELKIGGLKGIGGHTNEVAELESQLNNLRSTYQQLATSMQGNLSTDQLRTLSQQTYDTADKLNILNARIQDTKQKLENTSLNNFANDAGKIDKITEQFVNLKTKTVEVESAMKQFSTAVNNMKVAKQSGDVDKIVQSYKEYENAVKRVSAELKRASSVDSLNQERTNFSSQMDVWLNDNSAAAARFGSQIKALQKELASCDATRLNGIKTEFTEIIRQAQIAGVATQSFGDKFKDQLSKLSTYFSANMLITTSIRGLKEMYQNVMDIDTAFTELKKVTDETDASYNKFLSNAASNAKEIGTTIDNYITSSADFARLGYTFDQSQNLAKVANIYNVVGDEIADVNEATQSIISTMKAFDVETDNAISIVDKFNEVGNNFAISSGGIGEAMTRSASSMAAANNTMDETIALITAANTVIQDAPRVGNAFKTISMRIRGAKTELEEAGLDAEGMAESTAKLREEIMALSGVDIMIDDDTFKSTYQILDELSTKWQDLTDIQQASITELIAGKHQGNVISSLMNNFDIVRQALDVSLNSEGSAMKEHEKWMESLEARVQKLAVTFQSLSQTFLSSDFLKGLIDRLTTFVDIVDTVIGKIGVMPALIGAISIAMSFKGNGFIRLNADADGFLNRLTLMNASLGNIRRSIATMFSNSSNAFKTGGLKDLFSNVKSSTNNLLTNLIVSKSDINAIKDFNAEIDKGVTHQTAFYRTMQNTSSAAQSVVASAKGGKVEIDNLGKSMLSAKMSAIGLQAVTIALNMALTFGLSVAIQAVVTKLNDFIHAQQKAADAATETAEKSKEECNSYKEKVSSLDNLISKYKELANSDNKDWNTRDEIRNIQDEISALVGKQADNLDLVNGKLEDELELLKSAGKELNKNYVSSAISSYHDAVKKSEKSNGIAEIDRFDELGKKVNKFLFPQKNIGYTFSIVDGEKELAKLLNKAGYNVDYLLGKTYIADINGDIDERLQKLLEMRNFIEKEWGDYASSDIYNSITKQIDSYSETITEQQKAASTLLESVKRNIISDNNELDKIIVNSADSYEEYRQTLIELIRNSPDLSEAFKSGDIVNSDIESCVDIYMSTLENFSDYYDKWLNKYQGVELTLDVNIDSEVDGLDKLYNSIKESVSETGLAGESIKELKNRFQDLDSFDAGKLFTKTSIGVRLNQEELNRLEKEYENFKKTDIKDYLEKLENEYNNLTKEIDNCTDAKEKVDLYNQRDEVLKRIQDNAELATQYEGLVSAYNKWMQTLSSGVEAGDGYDNVVNQLKNMKDLVDKGLIGTNALRDYVNLLSGKDLSDASGTEVREEWDKLNQTISGTSYCMMDFIKDGSEGLQNMLNAIQQLNPEWAHMIDNNTWEFDFGDGTEVAEKLGTTVDFLYLTLGKLKDFGFDINYDSIYSGFDLLQTKAEEANQKLIELGKTDINFDFSVSGDELKNEIKEAQKIFDGFKNQDGTLNVDLEGYNEAESILTTLLFKKESLNQPDIFRVDVTQAQTEVNNVISLLQSFSNDYSELKIKTEIGADTTEVQKSIQDTLSKLNDVSGKVKVDLGLDDKKFKSSVDAIISSDVNVEAGVNLDESQLSTINDTINSISPEIMVTAGVDETAIADYIAEDKDTDAEVEYVPVHDKVDAYIAKDKNADAVVTYTPIHDAVETYINSIPETIPVNVTFTANGNIPTGGTIVSSGNENVAGANGTAYANGTLKGTVRFKKASSGVAKGDWSTKDSGTALVGELGQELLVRDGRYITIGENSAEFFEYKKGDIIFNAAQTKEILEKGKITNSKKRGKSLANGTAFVDGSGGFTGSSSSNKNNSSSSNKGNSHNNSGRSNNSTSRNDNRENTVLEKFQDWISKIFDWIEIKIQRQSAKIDKYIKKAENSKDAGSYGTSAKNYINAINSTATQIEYQKKGASKYKSQANKVVKNAVSIGLISKKESSDIKKKVKNGTINIKEYSKEVQEVIKDYQEWYEKSINASTAIEELHNNIRTYIKDLKDMRDAQRSARLENIDTYTTIGTNGYAFSWQTQNSQLSLNNSQLNKQDNAYKNEVDNVQKDVNSIGNKGKKAIKNALNSKDAKGKSKKAKQYKKALNNANKAIKSKKAISSADLKIIKSHSISVYNKLYAYNESLENLEIAKLEQATNAAATSAERYENIAQQYENKDTKTNDKISLLRKKSENANSARDKNILLNSVVTQYNTLISDDKAEISEYKNQENQSAKQIKKETGKGKNFKNLSKKDQKNVKKYIDKTKADVKNGVTIGSSIIAKLAEFYSKGYISESFYNSCLNYNNAIQHRYEAEAQLEIDEETVKQEKAAIGSEKFENVEQEYTNMQNALQSNKNKESSGQSLKSTRGVALTNSDYQNLLNYSRKEQQIYAEEILALNSMIYQNINNGLWTTTSQEYLDALNSVAGYEKLVIDCQNEQEELNNKIAQLPYETYEKALELLDSIAKYNKSVASLITAEKNDLSESNYLTQIDDNNKKIHQYENERIQAYSDYLKALSNVNHVYGGITSDEWLSKYYDLSSTINDLKSDNEEIRFSLRDDVYWRTFERAHTAAKELSDVLSGIASIIDESMFYSKDGKLTNFGTLQISNLIKQYENARKEVQNYTDDIQNLNKLYAQGYYNQDEFNEKLNELQNGLFDAASSMKSYISEIIDMNKKLAQSELDALLKLIDARNDALTAKKNYYDYDKTIKDRTKDIQALQAQIGALEGVETAEAKAQKARLEADLADKKDDLNDTIMNHSFELSKDALNELKTILQDEFDERWDNIGQDLNEIQKLIAAANELTAAQSHTVGDALNKLLSFYGINPSATDLNQFGNVTGYASGTRKVDKDKVAWTQENGQEVIVRKSDGAILTPLSRGDGVILNDLTNNLFDWGMHNPQEFADSLVRGIPDIPKVQSPITTVEQHYDSLLNVEGNVDSTVVTDLEKFAKTFYQGAYKYTVNEIARDARKKGIKA